MPSSTTLETTHRVTHRSATRSAPVVVAPEHPGPGAWAGAPSALRVGRTSTSPTGCAVPSARAAAMPTWWPGRPTGRFSTRRDVGKDRSAPSRWSARPWCVTAGGHLAALRQRGHAGHQALAGRPARVQHPRGPRDRAAADGDGGQRPARASRTPCARHDGRWHAWASCHPLDDPEATDRMTTEYATSADGVDWTWHGTALAGRAGRGTPAAYESGGAAGPRPLAWYDGRATAEQNWEEQTGLATVDSPGRLAPAVTRRPGSRRTASVASLRRLVTLEDGSTRFYVEVTRPDGAHDLRTVLDPAA